MFDKISLATVFCVLSLPAFTQTTVDGYKSSIANAPWEQVFEMGLRGVGSCKIVPAYLKGIKTWRVITSSTRPGVVGDGVTVGVDFPSLKIAHGFAWTPEFASNLSFPDRFFHPIRYNVFKGINSKNNAVLMLRSAVSNNLCNITSSSLPQISSVNISTISSDQIKNSFNFYLDSSRKLRCTSTVHSKPVFNPSTCKYETKKVVIGASACKRAFQKASVGGRASVSSQNTIRPRLSLPVVEAFTAEIERDMNAADLPYETHVMAALASERNDIQSVFDPSTIVEYTKPVLTAAERTSAAKFRYSINLAQGDFSKPTWLDSAHAAISARSDVTSINTVSFTDSQPLSASVINDNKLVYLAPIKNIYPGISATVSGCFHIEQFSPLNANFLMQQ